MDGIKDAINGRLYNQNSDARGIKRYIEKSSKIKYQPEAGRT